MTTKAQNKAEPTGRKTYTDPATGDMRKGAVVPLAKIRADEIWSKIKPWLDHHEIYGNRLLVAVYVRPEKTEGGIILADSYRQEDVWQGVTGLVVQRGPGAFKDSDKWKFHGQDIQVGDWITFQPPHSVLTKVGGQYDGMECRIIQDCYVLAKVSGPHVCF